MNTPKSNNTKYWESVCRRCGRCCYEKIECEEVVYITNVPCEYLDLETKMCRVYSHRDTTRPGCVRLTPMNINSGLLPPDCAYVETMNEIESPWPPLLNDTL